MLGGVLQSQLIHGLVKFCSANKSMVIGVMHDQLIHAWWSSAQPTDPWFGEVLLGQQKSHGHWSPAGALHSELIHGLWSYAHLTYPWLVEFCTAN